MAIVLKNSIINPNFVNKTKFKNSIMKSTQKVTCGFFFSLILFIWQLMIPPLKVLKAQNLASSYHL